LIIVIEQAQKVIGLLLSAVLITGSCLIGRAVGAEPSPGRVYIILWLDTEDYISPLSDDSAKRIAAFLTRQNVRATFKVVAEKARTLERRGRRDVIEAMGRHEIGYHSDTHSRHPIVTEYESVLNWESGIKEFTRRERAGFDDLRRIFGKLPTCYGQPGSSWAPQSYAALKEWGVGVYLDEGSHVGLNGKPFWYGGILNIFNTKEGPQLRSDDYWHWPSVNQAKAKFEKFYRRMASESGGIISLYFHPWEFVYREPWDMVNFVNGANPTHDEWKLPAAKNHQESEEAFAYFEELVNYIKSFPQTEFVTASQTLMLYRDNAQGHLFLPKELADIAKQVNSELSFQVREDYSLAASEVFYLLNKCVAGVALKKSAEPIMLNGTLYGPSSSSVELKQSIEISWGQFSQAVIDVADFLEKNRQIPNVVWLGSRAVSPESYLVALARVTSELLGKSGPPAFVSLGPANLAAKKYVAEDSPGLWGFIFPKGFTAPFMMNLAKLQAWTLKPARLSGSQ
jgi:peptidoglycan/xylan/chitin deacetylase (PgdA/CDA1 family)